jgi:hypothetical protein
MRIRHLALPLVVLALLFPESQAIAERGGSRGGGGGGNAQRGGGAGSGGQKRGSSPGSGGGGFGGGLSSGKSAGGSQRGNAGAETFGGGAGGFSAKSGAASGGAGRPGVGAGGAGQQGVGAGGAGRPGDGAGGAGKPGAAAGAAASNRNNPQHSGAQGAAAGAAASNRNNPQYSGAQGAAAGAAVANRNQPQYSGAQGAAAGAAVANRNNPQYSRAQGAAVGAAVANSNQPRYAGADGVGGPASGIGIRPGLGAGAAGVGLTRAAGTYYASTDALEAQQTAFRAGAAVYPNYSAAAFVNNASAWQPTNVVSQSLYTHPSYSGLARAFGMAAVPVAYDYGGNVVVQPDAVYVNGDVVGTPQQYAQQATAIASAGQSAKPATDSKWLPLGVFAVVEGDATSSDDIFQLAVNPQGIIRGNYNNVRTNQVETISGSVDKKTQRTAWTIGDDQSPTYEAGLTNLTKDITPMLVITADGQSHQMSLIRVPQPEQQTGENGAASTPEH